MQTILAINIVCFYIKTSLQIIKHETIKKILYSLMISILIISYNKPDQDDQNPTAGGDDLKKLVEKIDLIQDSTKLCSFELTDNVNKTIKTLAVKLTDKYTSGACNLAG